MPRPSAGIGLFVLQTVKSVIRHISPSVRRPWIPSTAICTRWRLAYAQYRAAPDPTEPPLHQGLSDKVDPGRPHESEVSEGRAVSRTASHGIEGAGQIRYTKTEIAAGWSIERGAGILDVYYPRPLELARKAQEYRKRKR